MWQKLEIPIIRTKTDTSSEFSCHYSWSTIMA